MESNEVRRKALNQLGRSHEKMENNIDKHVKNKAFEPRTLVLLWDKRREKLGMH